MMKPGVKNFYRGEETLLKNRGDTVSVQFNVSRLSSRGIVNALLLMPADDFAYLHDWGEIGVVDYVSQDLFRVGAEAGLKPFHRVAKDVAHADVRSWTTRLAASEAFVHRVVQAGIAHARLHQWHVFVAVVRMIEPGSRSVRVHHADLHHAMSPVCVISQYRSAIVSRQVNPEELAGSFGGFPLAPLAEERPTA